MTAQFLAAELTALIQDTKRKNADIRTAAEKSLTDLKALPNTSEAQLAADLRRKPNFVKPHLLACASKNGKFAGNAITSLQRLILSNGLAVETLKDTLEVLRECSGLAQDIQLKILQIIPSLIENYGSHIQKDLLVIAVHICCILFISKNAVVSNTAAATLQQLVVGVLAKVVKEDETSKTHDFVAEVPIEVGSISVMSAALDAYRLLDDMCLLLEGDRPVFLQPTSMAPNLGMELVEAMIASHPATIASHPELVHILRARLLPFVIRIISEPRPFPITVRAMRLLPIVFSNMLSALPSECEMILSLINHMLDPDSSTPWKRVLCMEVFRSVHNDAPLMRSIYAHFDEQQGKRTVVKDHLAMLVRISGEKPAIIGLGPQSTIPASSGQTEEEIDEMAAIQTDGIGGSIGVAMTLRSSTAPGISARLSVMRVPCLEQLDKIEAPQIPPAYLYTLVLTCMNNFSENLARFLLPYTIPHESRDKRRVKQSISDSSRPETSDGEKSDDQKPKLDRTSSNGPPKTPVNPLMLEGHPKHHQIRTAANMIEACWPALLAAYSTFFHAALDSEYYHALVRSFQKFTQVAGLLRLNTPRDAFLTTFGKNAVPSSIVTVQTPVHSVVANEIKDTRRGSKTTLPTTPAPGAQSEPTLASLNTRNLLCLRALLNLGIALGPVLQAAWTIILETLQQADLIINHVQTQRRHSRIGSATPTASNSDIDLLGDIGSEIAAVKIAATRMLESSAELPEEAFLDIVTSVSNLLRNLTDSDSPKEALLSTPGPRGQSIHTTALGGVHDPRANLFVVENLSKIVEFNKFRFLEHTSEHNGWHVFVNSFLALVSAQHLVADVRISAARGLDEVISLTALPEVSAETKDEMRQEGLIAIARQIEALSRKRRKEAVPKSCELDIHHMSLETLRSLLEQFGDSLVLGWSEVFTIVASAFEEPSLQTHPSIDEEEIITSKPVISAKSPKLIRSSFGSLQLICSDFLAAVPRECLTALLQAIHLFCLQQDDFNISLISTSLFCNVSDYLWQGEEKISLGVFRDDLHINLKSIEIQSFDHIKAEMLLRLLLIMTEITVDERLEIRHGAIHSIFRVFDSYGERFDPSDWTICLQQVVLRLFSCNQSSYSRTQNDLQGDDHINLLSWSDSAIVLLDNAGTLLGNNINFLLHEKDFPDIWIGLLDYLRIFLGRQSLALSTTVFLTTEKIVAEIERNNRPKFETCTKGVWELWEAGNPSKHQSHEKRSANNQAALSAYLHCLTALQPLLATSLTRDQLNTILRQLQICAVESSTTSYSDDTDNPTEVQAQIMEHLSHLDDRIPGAASEIIASISFFVALPFKRDTAGSSKGGPTFIAFSKTTMEILSSFILKHANDHTIYTDGSFLAALGALSLPISLKYKWRVESKLPSTWQKATTTAIDILGVTIPIQVDNEAMIPDVLDIWSCILSISNNIVSADEALVVQPTTESPGDQNFDIDSFQRLYSLLIPALGLSSIPDRLRRSFAKSIFENSLIHTPHPDDLPETESREILANLSSVHIGRTNDLRPSRRSRIAYVCLDKLSDLVAKHDGSSEQINLAQAAAPYLILRAGIVLKAYVLDQPLRGHMPMPASQRKELLYILQKLVSLNSEPKAIPDAPGIKSEEKKHLYRIYILATKALKVCRSDVVISNALMKVFEVCASDFGVD